MVRQLKGPITVFRIADKRHPLFDGIGAALLGARWNSPGLRVVYAALSYAGAMLEKLAQSGRVGDIPKNHQAIKIFIPASVQVEEIKSEDIKGWNLPDLIKSRQYGDKWIQEKRTAVLVVPAIIAVEEKNILINPEHPQFSMITTSKPREVVWDPRLFHP